MKVLYYYDNVPLIPIPFEKKYEVYAIKETKQLSIPGYEPTLECFKPKLQANAKMTPSAIEPENDKKKIPEPLKKEDIFKSAP